MNQVHNATQTCQVTRINGVTTMGLQDDLAVESPLTVVLEDWSRGVIRSENIAVTMRTPGEDANLGIGLLFTERLIRQRSDIESVQVVPAPSQTATVDKVVIKLRQGVTRAREPMLRRGHVHSSCGVCATVSPDDLQMPSDELPTSPTPNISANNIQQLIDHLRENQAIFQATGGLHAASIGNCQGHLLSTHEDIGRHNALDKLIGKKFFEQQLPLNDFVLLVSGRTSYELVHKAHIAGLRIVIGVGAASSLAVDYAIAAHMTLIGFARKNRLTIYTGEAQILENQL
ncbi:MAG: formate dehydrogenase accessory sulfurtransferase FdhD [Phycisphaerales bacterium]|nr:formate dehydrogenase accessory sulfurtransferase FdhD [Phycisphaerales bacterium]